MILIFVLIQKSTKMRILSQSQKRSHCPLTSMALATDRAGFACYCEISPGNVAESKTLQQLAAQGYPWVAVGRGAKPSAPQLPPDVTLVTSANSQVNGWKLECDERGVKVYLPSEHKHHADTSILETKRQRFERQLQRLHDGLSKSRYLKRLPKVHQRIGRLRQRYPKVASHYQVEVEASDDGAYAPAVIFCAALISSGPQSRSFEPTGS